MLAKEARHEKEGGQPLLGGLDVVVDRNFFGTQLQVGARMVHAALSSCIVAPNCPLPYAHASVAHGRALKRTLR